MDAQRRYHAAQGAGQSAKKVERLGLEAESQYQAVTEYQLRSLGGPAASCTSGDRGFIDSS
ncbi:hypothetical protein EI533_25665 [Pseudomonas donghuensis]|nr:hypothetical protein [Pseudomonas donghuensis]MBF4211093.1 hypothetical protein [Pseudomonas donghuensis]MCP6693671.1 hypothetical protein [Pseudomonas donghuensis]MCP6700144.1 hypothetical protein [Pseudomonas donghuensis]PJY94078.1 hypothetical protein COO64_23095 [Pseudomonas donghuensis]UVL27082.1 hypothetical protein LOY30_16060 [Pseudomonas donghuensis]